MFAPTSHIRSISSLWCSKVNALPIFGLSWCLHTPRSGYFLPFKKKPSFGSTLKNLQPNFVSTLSTSFPSTNSIASALYR